MLRQLLRALSLSFLALVALGGCDSSVVGGGGPDGGDGQGGAGGGADGGTGAETTEASATSGEATTSGSSSTSAVDVATSSGSGGVPFDVEGVIVPHDDVDVRFLLGNSAQSCAAPQTEPPCAPGERWVATITIPRADLVPGTYPLGTAEIPINVVESFDDCNGGGGRGWSGDPATLTIDSIDAEHAVITIEGAYDDVDGTWDVPRCG